MDLSEIRREHGLAVIGCLLIVGHLADHALVHGQETIPFAVMIGVTVLAVTLYRRAPTWLRVTRLSPGSCVFGSRLVELPRCDDH